jgi:TolA-binding protein
LCFLSVLCSSFVFAQDQAEIKLANEYLIKGEKQKALEMFRELVRKQQNIGLVHGNYVNTLLDLNQYAEAQDYIKKCMKREPENMLYQLDAGLIMVRSGEVQKADKHFREIIAQYNTNTGRIKSMSDYFMGRSLFDYAIASLAESRNAMGMQALYCLELATLYRIKGEKEKMTQEYLNYATQNTGNNQYIKSVLQVLLTKPDELETLERLLYKEEQVHPEEEVYTDLLIWVLLQQKNFYGAFVQARAYDRRYKTEGNRCMEVARVALDNKDYQQAAAAFQYVVKNYGQGEHQLDARLGYIQAREQRIRETYPIRKDSVASLIQAYRNFVEHNPEQTAALEASRNMANMYAEFLEQPDTALQQLTRLIANPRASVALKSRAKLDLADVYIMKEEPWESALLYAQVEKIQKETSIGYEAKLKSARLSYHRGDFRLAQEHLDILKEATTREIANDALDLSMLIKENIALDSAGHALKEFARVELLLKQNKTEQAQAVLKNIEQGISSEKLSREDCFLLNAQATDCRVTFSNHAIKDDCYWLEAKLNLQQNKPEEALVLLEKIVTEYPTDILADDAFFMIGEIYERHLGQKEKAMEQYKALLEQFSGSVYVAEARKRFRQLRGDFKQDEPKS